MTSCRNLSLRTWISVLLFCLLPMPALRAQGGPPFLTDDPGTPGDRHWEVNVAWVHERHPGEKQSLLPLVDVSYGLGDRWQLNYVAAYLHGQEEGAPARSGLDNSLFGVKWRYFDDEKSGLTMSVCPQVVFRNPGSNSVERGVADDENVFVLPFEFQREIGGWCFDAEIGAVCPSKSESGWMYGVVVGHALNDRVEGGIELHGEGTNDLSRTRLMAAVGIRLKLSENFRLLASIGRELHNGLEPRAQVISYLGIQWTR